MESVIGYTWEICMGDDIERCPSPEFGVFTDVMFSLNGRDMDKQGGQKKSRGGPQKPHTASPNHVNVTHHGTFAGGSVGFTRATQKPIK